MAYYIKDTGTETFPYDTEETAAKSLNRLAKQLSSYEFIPLDVEVTNQGYDVAFNPARIPPFPILDQAVEISCIIKQYDIFNVPGTVYGHTMFKVGLYSFDTSSTYSSGVNYTMTITKGYDTLTSFSKFISGTDREFTFIVKSTTIEFYVDNSYISSDVHGFTTWEELFTTDQVVGYFTYFGTKPKISIGELNAQNTTLVVSEWHGPADRTENIEFTESDIIYIASDIIEPSVTDEDSQENGLSFNGAIITSLGIQRSWSLRSESFMGLSPQNISISGLYQTVYNYFYNPKKDICNNIFRDFGDAFYIDEDCIDPINIWGNTFRGEKDTTIGTISGTMVPIDIYNNTFDGSMFLIVDNCPGAVNIYNNIFMNNQAFACMDIEYYSEILNVHVINNTFFNMGVDTNAFYVYADDSSGYIETLLIFNNIVDSGAGIYLDLYIENPDNIHTFIHSNNNSSGYIYTNNGDPFPLGLMEITADPNFEGTPPDPLRLLDTSPSYATGLVDERAPTEDILGVTRKQPPDMGAYETVSSLVVDFVGSPLTGAANLTVEFTDTTTEAPLSWDWDFGDGSPHSPEQNPTHEYETAGEYTVSLTCTRGTVSNTNTKIGYISVNLLADFTGSPLTGTANLIVAFTDATIGTPTGWDWDFGDGSAHSSDQNPTHVYETAGVYTVSLISTRGAVSNTITKTEYVTVNLLTDFYC